MDKTLRWWLMKLFNHHVHEWSVWEVVETRQWGMHTKDGFRNKGYITYMKRTCETCKEVELKNTQTGL